MHHWVVKLEVVSDFDYVCVCVCACARERERSRERKPIGSREKTEREWLGEHLLHSTLCFKPFVLLLIRCPHGTVLLDMVGLDRMAAGMDVDEAAGLENPRYAPRTSGSARSAALETGGVVRNADTVRVSRTRLRRCNRPRSRRKSLSWRRA